MTGQGTARHQRPDHRGRAISIPWSAIKCPRRLRARSAAIGKAHTAYQAHVRAEREPYRDRGDHSEIGIAVAPGAPRGAHDEYITTSSGYVTSRIAAACGGCRWRLSSQRYGMFQIDAPVITPVFAPWSERNIPGVRIITGTANE